MALTVPHQMLNCRLKCHVGLQYDVDLIDPEWCFRQRVDQFREHSVITDRLGYRCSSQFLLFALEFHQELGNRFLRWIEGVSLEVVLDFVLEYTIGGIIHNLQSIPHSNWITRSDASLDQILMLDFDRPNDSLNCYLRPSIEVVDCSPWCQWINFDSP